MKDDVEPDEVAGKLKELAEKSRERRLSSNYEGDAILRLCHVTAECVEEAHRRLASAVGNDDRLADAYESAVMLLSEQAIEFDETRRRGHIEASQALLQRIGNMIYSPTEARTLLEALTTRTDMRGSDDRAYDWLVGSLRRAVANHLGFAMVIDTHLL